MYYLTLGHHPDLSRLELTSLGFAVTSLSPSLVSVDNSAIIRFAERLGGTTRIMEQVQTTTPAALLTDLGNLIETSGVKNHAVTNYTSVSLPPADLSRLKSSLSRPARFLSFATSGHSIVALRKQHVAEFSLLQDQAHLVLARTIWLQDADNWSLRDRGRPYLDIKRGMLPPKLARLMVNLATQGNSGTLLDPFCGTGTILMEAALVGCSVIGSDCNERAVTGTHHNLSWLTAHYQLSSTKYQVLMSDATHLSNQLGKVDFIVTEPYLGPLLDQTHPPSLEKIRNIAKGLHKLYLGALKDWRRLSPRRLVIILPEFHLHGQVITSLQVDALTALGYNTTSQTPYSQPGAIVVRNITVLTTN